MFKKNNNKPNYIYMNVFIFKFKYKQNFKNLSSILLLFVWKLENFNYFFLNVLIKCRIEITPNLLKTSYYVRVEENGTKFHKKKSLTVKEKGQTNGGGGGG